MLKKLLAGLGLACVLCAAAPADDAFTVVNGKIMRGTKAFTVRAVPAPGLTQSSAKISEMVPALVKAGACGADAVWCDVPGLNAQDGSMDPKAVATLDAIATRAKDSRFAFVVRVPGAGGTPEWRAKATENAAKALQKSTFAIYWFDGPDAGALAKIFKANAPKCTTVAPENSDIKSVDAEPTAPNPMTMLIDKIPADPWGDQHFLMRGEEAYAAVEAAMTRPEEKAPYTPDNSMLSEEERKDGFNSMFNGKDLSGWWFYGQDKGGFKVTPEGTIAWVRAGGEGLLSRKRYKDFIFRWEFKLAKDGDNSGTYIRAPRAGRQSKLGFEFQEMGDAGKAPEEHVTGAVYDVRSPLVNAAKPVGQWNQAEVDFRGGHLKATLNGQVIHDFDFDTVEELKYRNREGFIGLQDHACQAEWRNLRIKELN